MSNQKLYMEALTPFNEGLLTNQNQERYEFYNGNQSHQQRNEFSKQQIRNNQSHCRTPQEMGVSHLEMSYSPQNISPSDQLNYTINSIQLFQQDEYFNNDEEDAFSKIQISSGFVAAPQQVMGEMVTLPRYNNDNGAEFNDNQNQSMQQMQMNNHVNQGYSQQLQPQMDHYQTQPTQQFPPNQQQQYKQVPPPQQQYMNHYPEQNPNATSNLHRTQQPPQVLLPQEKPLPFRKEAPSRNYISFIDKLENDNSEKQFMYLCIPVNRRKRNICLGITTVVLIAFAIIIGIFYPRFPQMQVLSINPIGNNSYQLTNFNRANPNNFKFTMNMIMEVSVVNTNMYHLKIDKIDLTTFVNANGTAINNANPSPVQALLGIQSERVYVTAANYKNQIGTGSYGTIIFPPNVNVTFTMNLNINYSPGPLGALNDPTLNEMIQLCVEGDPTKDSGRRTTISYTAVNSVGILKYIGYNPTMRNSIRIRCPFQGSARTAFITALTIMQSFFKRFAIFQYYKILNLAKNAKQNTKINGNMNQELVSASVLKNSVELAQRLDIMLYQANPQPLLEIRPSSISKKAGLGVFVNGSIEKGEICSLYPGTVYDDSASSLFIQSIGNHYLFKSFDSVFIDGKKTGLSKILFWSHWKRNRWRALDFTSNALPFFNGQMINDGDGNANCRYQELDLNPYLYDFKNHRKLPNVYERLDWDPLGEIRRVVLIIATRDIHNEELLSSYNEIVS